MANLDLVGDDAAATRAAFGGARKKLDAVPNLFRVIGNAPAVLNGYFAFAGSSGKGAVPPALGERIAVAEAEGCEYCLAAHSVIGAGAGLSEDDIAAAQAGAAADPRDAAAITVLANQGRASDGDLAQVRAAGWDDAAIVEISAQVAVNVFTNTVNNVARTPIDFPARRPRRAA